MAERNWVEEMAKDGWEVEYFYYGHMEGDLWRRRSGEYQREFEVSIPSFRTDPDPHSARIQSEIQSLLSRYGQDVRDLNLTWHEQAGRSEPAAWLRGWRPSDEEAYLSAKEGAWKKPDGDYAVPQIFIDSPDYSHSEPLDELGGNEAAGTDR